MLSNPQALPGLWEVERTAETDRQREAQRCTTSKPSKSPADPDAAFSTTHGVRKDSRADRCLTLTSPEQDAGVRDDRPAPRQASPQQLARVVAILLDRGAPSPQ